MQGSDVPVGTHTNVGKHTDMQAADAGLSLHRSPVVVKMEFNVKDQ